MLFIILVEIEFQIISLIFWMKIRFILFISHYQLDRENIMNRWEDKKMKKKNYPSKIQASFQMPELRVESKKFDLQRQRFTG